VCFCATSAFSSASSLARSALCLTRLMMGSTNGSEAIISARSINAVQTYLTYPTYPTYSTYLT